jgi:hypothetical protein
MSPEPNTQGAAASSCSQPEYTTRVKCMIVISLAVICWGITVLALVAIDILAS